jgi:hypothetical protein
MDWIAGACLTLMLVVGLTLPAQAQQPTATPETKQQAPDSSTQQAPQGSQTPPAAKSEDKSQTQTPPPPVVVERDRQVETRTERVEQAPARFLGVDPTVAMIIAAALVVVIVIAMVAMSKGADDSRRSA